MAIYDFLPKYHQIEVNVLKGLYPGFVVAQMEVDKGASSDYTDATFTKEKFNKVGSTAETNTKMIANGHIVQISENGITDVKDATSPLFLVYNEPLPTVVDSPKFYATNLDEECLRLVQLMPGDEWTSDMDILNASYPGQTNLTDRIKEVTGESRMSGDDWFKNNELPDGTKAKHYIFLK